MVQEWQAVCKTVWYIRIRQMQDLFQAWEHNPQPQQTAPAHAYTGIQKPRQPESTVKPVEINIPDFLKNSRR